MFKKKNSVKEYDHENKIPVLHCSICNGEQVAGFKDKQTGIFDEVMFISNQNDLDTFMNSYGIVDIKKEY